LTDGRVGRSAGIARVRRAAGATARGIGIVLTGMLVIAVSVVVLLQFDGIATRAVNAAAARFAPWAGTRVAHVDLDGLGGITVAGLRIHDADGDTLVAADTVRLRADLLPLLARAAQAVVDSRWQAPAGHCHGLAGNGELLLDLHHFLEQPRYRAMAESLAVTAYLRHVRVDGRALFTSDDGYTLSSSFGVGNAGVGCFLHRLVHGGERRLMVDGPWLAELESRVVLSLEEPG